MSTWNSCTLMSQVWYLHIIQSEISQNWGKIMNFYMRSHQPILRYLDTETIKRQISLHRHLNNALWHVFVVTATRLLLLRFDIAVIINCLRSFLLVPGIAINKGGMVQAEILKTRISEMWFSAIWASPLSCGLDKFAGSASLARLATPRPRNALLRHKQLYLRRKSWIAFPSAPGSSISYLRFKFLCIFAVSMRVVGKLFTSTTIITFLTCVFNIVLFISSRTIFITFSIHFIFKGSRAFLMTNKLFHLQYKKIVFCDVTKT